MSISPGGKFKGNSHKLCMKHEILKTGCVIEDCD